MLSYVCSTKHPSHITAIHNILLFYPFNKILHYIPPLFFQELRALANGIINFTTKSYIQQRKQFVAIIKPDSISINVILRISRLFLPARMIYLANHTYHLLKFYDATLYKEMWVTKIYFKSRHIIFLKVCLIFMLLEKLSETRMRKAVRYSFWILYTIKLPLLGY